MSTNKEIEYPSSLQPIPENAKLVFKGLIFEVWQWQQTMFDGSVKTFEKAKRRSSVGILPITKDGKIIISYQQQPQMRPFISLLGGVVDDGEDPIDAAERELLEEAGMKAEKIDLWFAVQPVTKVEWPIYIFIAKGCEEIANQNLDSGEKIEIKKIDWEEFEDLVLDENFRDSEIKYSFLKAMQADGGLEKLKNFIFSK